MHTLQKSAHFIMVIATALLQCIDHFIKNCLDHTHQVEGGAYCLDIEGPDMGGLAIVTNFVHDNIYYRTVKCSGKFGD